MTVREDPEGLELRAIERHLSFKGKDVLEIGCGDGRFTSKFFDKPRSLVAIDPDSDAVRIAETKIPSRSSHKVRLGVGEAEKLGFPPGSFDAVIFTWSLCCVQDAKKSLEEAHRVLRAGGTLVNIMPEALPSFEMATLKALGGKDVIRQGSLEAFRAIVRVVQDGLFVHLDDERILFDTYFDSIDDLIVWLPSAPGPLNKEEFGSLSRKALDLIRDYASSLKKDGGLRVRDFLIASSAVKGIA